MRLRFVRIYPPNYCPHCGYIMSGSICRQCGYKH
jgi:ribosomal protein L32